MRPKQQRGEVTVDRILDAALRLYEKQGEAGLTVAALTRETGVSTGSIYHHFGSLDGVLGGLTQRWLDRLYDEIRAALWSSDDARLGIRALVEAYLGFMIDHPVVGRMLHSARVDEQGWKHAREMRGAQEARLALVTDWIKEHQEAGRLAPISAALAESLVLGPVVGSTRRWVAVGDVDLKEATRELPDRIWRAVAP